MSGPVTLEALDLAALLCSRVCHDLISPAGAIVNGLEVLDEGGDAETRTFAMDLIRKSARTASARLQFCRIAFGAAGSAGAQVDTGDAENVARGFIEDDLFFFFFTVISSMAVANQSTQCPNSEVRVANAQSIPLARSRHVNLSRVPLFPSRFNPAYPETSSCPAP